MSRATLTVYYDYTCRYSYRALHWLDRVQAARPTLHVDWRTFSLKEVNRPENEPPYLRAGAEPSLSVLALALAHAAREADFSRYHHTVFEAMHGEERKLGEEDLLAIAKESGVGDFDRDRRTAEVGAEHKEAVALRGVYGTPTLIFDNAGTYMRLTGFPETDEEALSLLDSLEGVAAARINLVEVFVPHEPSPPTIPLGLPEKPA
jgi:predicted DsbA family dithiol-disulfide isomerase